jgi:hypothetical protein
MRKNLRSMLQLATFTIYGYPPATATRVHQRWSGFVRHKTFKPPQHVGGLTNRWNGRVKDKVPSSYGGARAAQLNR